jgi:hypothetical protein
MPQGLARGPPLRGLAGSALLIPGEIPPAVFRQGQKRVTIVAVVLGLGVCDQGNLCLVLGWVSTRGWLVTSVVDPCPFIPPAENPDDPARVLVT